MPANQSIKVYLPESLLIILLKMELNRKLISCYRKTKAFRSNFEKLLAIANFNNILVMTAGEFRIIDVRSLPGLTYKLSFIDY
jgi:hypothetical protein